MPFATVLYADENASAVVTSIWKRLAEKNVTSQMIKDTFRPHITLGISEDLDIKQARAHLKTFAGEHERFKLTMSTLSAFPGERSSVFLGVTATAELLAFHDEFYRGFHQFANGFRQYYVPGHWVPHCTLADGLPCDMVPQAIDVCQVTHLPLTFYVIEMGVLQFPPGNELFSYKLRS